jgi:hypothetical protein
MTISRYNRIPVETKNGKRFKASSKASKVIYSMVKSKKIQVKKFVLAEGQRLDLVSANFYGSAEYWWVIAAASGIGWQCQVPPGTLLKIPVSIQAIVDIIG